MLLMHENTPVADVVMQLGHIIRVTKIYNEILLPPGTRKANRGNLSIFMENWQKERAIPFNRQCLDQYTSYFETSILEAAQIFGSLSLTDHYWFKEETDDEKWEDICFQKNGFSNQLADYILLEKKAGKPMPVPDVNTDGVLQKIWIHTSDGPVLYKYGDFGNDCNCNLLSANEVVGSRVGNLMEVPVVQYKIARLPDEDIPVCACESFVPDSSEFITAAQLQKDYMGEPFDLYTQMSKMGFKENLDQMILFDFLLHNKDRHLKNFGFERDAESLEITRFSPLFDQGSCLAFDGILNDASTKPFKASRSEQIAMLDKIPDIPLQSEIEAIIEDVYAEFSVPERQLRIAKEDLKTTYRELQRYQTVFGPWSYATVDDGQVDLAQENYLVIGTLDSYEKLREYYGKEALVPLYVMVDDGVRLERALARERQQKVPKYAELCRRFLADEADFAPERLKGLDVTEAFENRELDVCVRAIADRIQMEGRQEGADC